LIEITWNWGALMYYVFFSCKYWDIYWNNTIKLECDRYIARK
jgi:hypothetical protein